MCALCPSTTFLRPRACACRSWRKAITMLFSSIPPPPSPLSSPTSLLSQAPGAASILLSPLFTHCLSLLKETVLVRSYLITLPCPPFLTKFLLFFAATPRAPSSLLGSPRTVPHQPCSPQGCHHLFPCRSSCSFPWRTLHYHHRLSTLISATSRLLALHAHTSQA